MRTRVRLALAAAALAAAVAIPADVLAAPGSQGPTSEGKPPMAGAPPATLHATGGSVSLRSALGMRRAAGLTLHRSRVARRALRLGATPCEIEGSGPALCGTFDAPLDWKHPHRAGTMPIDYALLTHSNPGPATSTIWWNGGGPGPSTTRNEGFAVDFLFGPLRDRFDILLTDVRGTGSSAPACPALQLFTGYFPGVANHAPLDACAASVAPRADFYGSASSARDLNAIRSALGIPRLDIVGNSYGGMLVPAYALRFPKHTRSVIISSGVDSEQTLRSALVNETAGTARIVELLCTRSPACSTGVGDARAALAAGIARLHAAPIRGVTASANNPVPHPVELTEAGLLTLLQESDDATFLSSAGEVAAAFQALSRGDEAPLLRIAGDFMDVETVGDPPPAEVNSNGGYYAIMCDDYHLPWRQGLTPQGRIAAAARVAGRIPAARLGGFDGASIVRDPVYADWEQQIGCNRWVDTNADEPEPDDRRYPRVPALIMTTDFDTRVTLENARRIAPRWPNGQLLDTGGGLHGAAFWGCGSDRVRAFLTAPGSHQAPCDAGDFPSFRAVGEFPVTGDDARPLAVDPAGTDASTVHDRRLAAAALETALDANSVTARQFGLFAGVGLRGGTFDAFADDTHFEIDLHGARFASDVAVDGSMVFPFDGSTQSIDITFTADDGTVGALTVNANWAMGRSASDPDIVPVRGTIGGRPVALLLPL